MMRAAGICGALVLALHGPAVLACGHCDEDKIAAVYDHAAVTQALERQQQVAYFSIEGELAVSGESRKALEALALSLGGVAKSMKISMESAALSFVFDPKSQKLASLKKAIEAKLAGQNLRLRLLKTTIRANHEHSI